MIILEPRKKVVDKIYTIDKKGKYGKRPIKEQILLSKSDALKIKPQDKHTDRPGKGNDIGQSQVCINKKDREKSTGGKKV